LATSVNLPTQTKSLLLRENYAMLHSMTGYGRATASDLDKNFTVEIRALNSKTLDLTIKLPQEFRNKEIDFRKQISDRLQRGKIDVLIQVENQSSNPTITINHEVAKALYQQINKLEVELNRFSTDPLALILRIPEVYNTKSEPNDQEFELLNGLLEQALNELESFRAQEGAALAREFETNISAIGELISKLEPFEEERVDLIKQRMRKNLEDKLADYIDQNRLEQEFIMYIEKLDISEEKMRLSNHLDYFLSTMKEGKDVGKKLGFIAQEIGREINTLGSKSNHAEMQKVVVQMKELLEKIKEQILNTL
jgi:uncharacterized protein (TIGR00255 family)